MSCILNTVVFIAWYAIKKICASPNISDENKDKMDKACGMYGGEVCV